MTLKLLRRGLVSVCMLCTLIIAGSAPLRRDQIARYGELRREWNGWSEKWSNEAVINDDGQELVLPSDADPVTVNLDRAFDGLLLIKWRLRMLRTVRHHAAMMLGVLLMVFAFVSYQLRGQGLCGWFRGRWRESLGDLHEEWRGAKVPQLGLHGARRWYWYQVVRSVVWLVVCSVLRNMRSGDRIPYK